MYIGLCENTIDPKTISLDDYFQIAFLALFAGNETNSELSVVFHGNVYHLHTCLTKVEPSQPVVSMREKQ